MPVRIMEMDLLMDISGSQVLSVLALLTLDLHPDPTLRCGPSPKARAKVLGALSSSLSREDREQDL